LRLRCGCKAEADHETDLCEKCHVRPDALKAIQWVS
jgi:hypothetical protein